jgi:hypothetical protein
LLSLFISGPLQDHLLVCQTAAKKINKKNFI